jgi:hypothetical protein
VLRGRFAVVRSRIMVYALFAFTALLAAVGTTMAHPGEHGQHRHRRGEDYGSGMVFSDFFAHRMCFSTTSPSLRMSAYLICTKVDNNLN